FLTDVATHVSEYRSGTVDYVQANQEIDRAMISVLWKALKAPQYSFENEPSYDAEIEVELTGSATFYLDRRQYVRDQAAKAGQQKVVREGEPPRRARPRWQHSRRACGGSDGPCTTSRSPGGISSVDRAWGTGARRKMAACTA